MQSKSEGNPTDMREGETRLQYVARLAHRAELSDNQLRMLGLAAEPFVPVGAPSVDAAAMEYRLMQERQAVEAVRVAYRCAVYLYNMVYHG